MYLWFWLLEVVLIFYFLKIKCINIFGWKLLCKNVCFKINDILIFVDMVDMNVFRGFIDFEVILFFFFVFDFVFLVFNLVDIIFIFFVSIFFFLRRVLVVFII